jgi:A/G-specific adenine glycosylase
MNFTSIITHWYTKNKRDLPWRKTTNPYNIWLSEIIFQQTQIKQGLPYYEAFVKKFPTVKHLALANEEEVLKLWQGLGYYSRARNMHKTAQFVWHELNGVFPKDYKALINLKGVGEYTASAIASICFNEPKAVVDGNVYRVLARFFGIDTPINSTEGIKTFKILAQSLIDESIPGIYNQAVMEFGALQCKPQNPDCSVCPLSHACVAFKNSQIKELPIKLKKTKIKIKHFNYLVFISNNRQSVFEKRVGNGIWQNLYQFPLIESPHALNEEEITQHTIFDTHVQNNNFEIYLFNEKPIIHKLTHRHLHTHFWIVEINHLTKNVVLFDDIVKYPTPQLISNFLDTFNLK